MAAKLQTGDGRSRLEDFLEQMQAVQKMGSMSKLLGMLPGIGDVRDADRRPSTTGTSTGSRRSSSR